MPPSNISKTAFKPGLLRSVTGGGAQAGLFSSSSDGFQPYGLLGSISSARRAASWAWAGAPNWS